MMELNRNSEPECVIGKPYSHSTLMGMTKKELIGLLEIAQRNYGVVNGRLYNSNSYLERLDKALDKAVELLSDYSGSCPYDMFDSDMNCQERCTNDTKKCWKEYLLRVAIIG